MASEPGNVVCCGSGVVLAEDGDFAMRVVNRETLDPDLVDCDSDTAMN